MKKGIAVVIIALFIVSAVSPMVIGFESDAIEYDDKSEELLDNLAFHCYEPNGLDTEKYEYYKEKLVKDKSLNKVENEDELTQPIEPTTSISSGGPLDSPWPMKSHDINHTGRSEYSTFNNSGYEKWRFRSGLWGNIESSAVIDNNGTIYFGTLDSVYDNFFAVYPNGTLKWSFRTGGLIWSSPAIAEDGTIYVGSWDHYLYALNPNGTRKWRFLARDDISSSPAIADDGTIYFGTMGDGCRIIAVNPNGTRKWYYDTGYYIVSDPAIGPDGTIYIGSGDNYLYAMNPNGTLKWRYKTGDWIKGHPSIGKDGTIYISSWDDNLHAVYPNGTRKWKRSGFGYGSSGGFAIGEDGTIYYMNDNFQAIFPDNGTIKWRLNIGGRGAHFSPAISSDGTIYVCNYEGRHLVAVKPDGTEKWRRKISNEWADSSPIIGEDGTIYVGSTWLDEHTHSWYGYFFAFGTGGIIEVDAHGPYYGLINEPVQFYETIDYGYPPYQREWDFGDGYTSDEQNPKHIYSSPGNYTVTFTVTDDSGNISYDTAWAWIQESNEPPDAPSIDGPKRGMLDKAHNYTFVTDDPEGAMVRYYIEWDDTTHTGWTGYFPSGEEIIKSHTYVPFYEWWKRRTFTIRCKSMDPYGEESEWGEFKITMPKSQNSNYMWLENFSILNRLFNRFIERLNL